MTDDRPITVEDFFNVRRGLTEVGQAAESQLDDWDDKLRALARTDPDTAARILDTLAASSRSDDREIAAIYVRYLFPVRREQATDLLEKLFQDAHVDVRRQALSTIDEITSDPGLTPKHGVRLAEAFRKKVR